MIRIISFSDRGEALALRLAEAMGGRADRAGALKKIPAQEKQGASDPAGEAIADGTSAEGLSVPEGKGQSGVGRVSLASWTREAFDSADALIFVGAAGIAVRAIAPYVRSKASDPAVVVVDETGAYAIPILSGHLGGANRLAREIAAVIGAEAVITTATDRNELWAVDDWARENGCRIPDPRGIKNVSAKVLRGEKLQIFSEFPLEGGLRPELALTDDPNVADVIIGVHCYEGTVGLLVVPPVCVLGIGCRKGTSAELMESHFETLLAENDIHPLAVTAAASIDLKAGEPGILEFCGRRGFSFSTWTAEELNGVAGEFHGSAFVARTVGTDNVCERSAVLAAGGPVLVPKCAGEGVTMALAIRPFVVEIGRR